MSSRASDGSARPHSLRRRLLALMLLGIAVASLIQAVTAYRTALNTADALFDLQLQELARSIDAGVPFGRSGTRLYEFSIEVWGPDGVRSFRSEGFRVPAQPQIGFSDTTVDGVRYRVYQLRTGQQTVQVAQNLDQRRARAREFALQSALPVALLAPLLMLAAWILIHRSLRPVERVRRQVAGRPPEDLSPLPRAGLPLEILPLVDELNLLFDRTKEAMAAQQQFLADAAHEMRTPLAALKLQVQDLQRQPPGPQMEAALSRLAQGVDRATRLGSQMLDLARAEHASEAEPRQLIELQELCRRAAEDVLPDAHARAVDLGVAASHQARVSGRPQALQVMLRNLLDNAIKFAPAGGTVNMAVRREGEAAVLSVEDNGPGIPPQEHGRVFGRFYRAAAAEVPGSGLGLAIVAAVARQHGAEVRLGKSPTLGGLRVEVVFPAALSEA